MLRLSPAEANENRPVRLRGAVTCYVPGSQLCFIQGETAGVYVLPSPWPKELSFGEVVEVQGVTGSGRFSPIVQWATVRSTGKRTRPVAKPISIEELNSGRFDCQWVRLEGVVQSLDLINDAVFSLQLRTGSSSANILAFGWPAAPTNLIDASVRIEGVGGTFYRDDRLSGFGLFVRGPEHLQVVLPAPDPFGASIHPIAKLAWYSPDGALDHRTHIRGVATVVWPGETCFLQDGSGAIRVAASAGQAKGVQPGDLLEAAGFVRDLITMPRMDNALFRKHGTTNLPPAPVLTLRQLLSRPPSGEYVTVEGTVSGLRKVEGASLLALQSGDESVTAMFKQEAVPAIRAGSLVRLTGAWSGPPAILRNETGPVLWLQPGAGFLLLAGPKAPPLPLETHRLLWLGAVAAVLLLLAGGIQVRARQRTARVLVEAESRKQRLSETERELQRLTEARERLGRDLHDRIIQSIYAIGLNLDDCAQSAPREPGKVELRLRGALRDVNAVISELRNVILGLETNAIQPREFRTALKSLALALGREESNRIRLDIDENALAALTSAQATELVHIAREALSNSIRHGGAQTTIFSLELHEDRLDFGIQDDGRGFDQKTVEGKGFGLRNMAKRAENLGAVFTVRSEEGHGTRILLDIPRQKQHFSPNERARIDR